MKVCLKGSIASFVVRLLGGAAGHSSNSRVPDLSGVWTLKVKESDFGTGRVPISVEVTLAHHEPFLRYSGAFVDQDGTSIPFDVKTRLDRPTSSVCATVISRRIDPFTTVSEWRYKNPPGIETTIMTVSSDGCFLTVKRHVERPEEAFDCTERYERQMVQKTSRIPSESLVTDLLNLATFGSASPGESVAATLDAGLCAQALVARAAHPGSDR
jgi:hypothetical protein